LPHYFLLISYVIIGNSKPTDEFIVYGSKNSILVDTINYTNEFNKENERKAKEKEEQDAMSKEQARAMIKMLADLNVKTETETVDEKVH
jgi:hypothetical protein